MKSSILDFFLLILEILLNFSSDACYKYNKFFETLLKKVINLFQVKKRVLSCFTKVLYYY